MFQMFIVLQKISEISDWELWFFMIDMSEAFCYDIADDGIILEVLDGLTHSNEVI